MGKVKMKLQNENGTSGETLSLSNAAKQCRMLEDAQLNLEKQLDACCQSISVADVQLAKVQFEWNKMSKHQQSLSILMKQMKKVQSVWKLQLKINVQMKKLSTKYGFNSDDKQKKN